MESTGISVIYKILRVFPDKEIMKLLFSYDSPIIKSLLSIKGGIQPLNIEHVLDSVLSIVLEPHTYQADKINPEILNDCLKILIGDFLKEYTFRNEDKYNHYTSYGFETLHKIFTNNRLLGNYTETLLKSEEGIAIFKNIVSILLETFYGKDSVNKIIDRVKKEIENPNRYELKLLINKINNNYSTGTVLVPIEQLYKQSKKILDDRKKRLSDMFRDGAQSSYVKDYIKAADELLSMLKDKRDEVYDQLLDIKLEIFKNRIGVDIYFEISLKIFNIKILCQ